MHWRVSKKEAAARRSSKMEGRDHSNAANPKSLMSRGTLKKWLTATVLAFFWLGTFAQTLTITSPAYGVTYQCGQSVDIFVSGYTDDDWQEHLVLEYSCLVGEPQPTNDNEPAICRFIAYPRKEAAYSFTFSPETPSIWEGRWVKLVAQNKKNGVRSEPHYIRVAAISYDKAVNVATPGTLCSEIGPQKNTITSLKVTGNLNGADILCLREMAGSDINGGSTSGNLAILDMKGANIIASSGVSNYYYNTRTTTNNTIGQYMFYNCIKLKSIAFPSSVTTIENNAFQFTGLTGISIPKNVTMIGWTGSYAFSNCSNLKTITIEDVTVELTFMGGTDNFSSSPIETLYLGRNISTNYIYSEYPFREKSALKNVTIGNDVTTINKGSFYNCTGLNSLTMGNALTSIGENAFFGCSSLAGVLNIPNKVKTVGIGAFQDCRTLLSVTIPNSVTSIGNDAFSGCSNLKTVSIEDGTVALISYYNTFANAPIETLYLGRNLSTNYLYSGYPFRDNTALKKVTISNDVTEINNNSFYNCAGLQSLTLGNALITIGDNAFRGCSSLAGVLIPNKVTTIGNGAFQDCRTLPSVAIPNSVTSIGNDAFSGCSNMKTVTIEDGAVALTSYYNTFTNTPLDTLYLGRNLSTNYLYSGYPFRDNANLETVTIGNEVTTINANSFYNCSGMTKAIIGSKVISLGTNAFYGCNGLRELHSLNPTPPTAPDNCFFNMYATCTLIVPEGSKDIYCEATEWKKFCSPPITYTVSYNGNGNTGGSTASTIHVYDVAKALTCNGFTRAYTVTFNYNGNGASNTTATATYTFKEWSSMQAGGSLTYKDCQSVVNLTTTDKETITLYAQWNSGSVTLPAPPTRANYIFEGWFTASSGGNLIGKEGIYTPTTGITLFAQWKEDDTDGYETPDAPLAKIYPNPTDGVIHLEFESPGAHNVTIATTSGTMLMRQVIADTIYSIDIGSYPAGLYLLIIDDGKQQSVTKVIKN